MKARREFIPSTFKGDINSHLYNKDGELKK
jgi:hypothetical protein